MSEQEKTRKYMLKDIIRHNLKFWWIIVLCMIICASILGYRKYSACQKRFATMELKGTTYRVTATLYCGNINSNSVYTRVDDVKKLLESNTMYETYVNDYKYSMDYAGYEEIFKVYTEYDNDYLQINFTYPIEWEDASVFTENEAVAELNKYVTTAMKMCNDIIGDGVVRNIGVGAVASSTNLPTDKDYMSAKQDTVKQTVIGAVIGAIFAIAVITLIYLLNVTIRTPQGIAMIANMRLLSFVNNDDVKELRKVAMLLEADSETKVVNFMALTTQVTGIAQKLADCINETNKKVVCFEFISGTKFEAEAFKKLITESKANYDYVLVSSVDDDSMDAYAISNQCDTTAIIAQVGKHKEEDIIKVTDTIELFNITCSGVIVYEPCK